MSNIGSFFQNRYKILQRMGEGGFGTTFIAEDTLRPGCPLCVVKQLRITDHPIAKELFAAEAELLEKLGKHPQIPTLLAYFEEGGELYLVQEFIEGQSLDIEIYPQNGFSEAQVVDLLKEILSILFFIHNNRVIHRDVKPSNIIRIISDKKLVLIDFGAVKQIKGRWGGRDIIIGTIGYMSHEQRDGRLRLNSDIYALGMTAIHALTGIHVTGLPEDVFNRVEWRHLVQVSEELAEIIDKMVHPDYRKRYQLATEVLDDLRYLSSDKYRNQVY